MELDDQKIQVEGEVRKVKMDAFVASHSAVLLPHEYNDDQAHPIMCR